MARGGDEPVAVAVGRYRGRDDRVRPHLAPGTALVAGVAERVDAAVGTDQPVPLVVRGGDYGDDGSGQLPAEDRAEVGGPPDRDHLAVGLSEVVGKVMGHDGFP